MSSTGSIPNSYDEVKVTMKEVGTLFGICAATLIFLIVFRVMINVIIIDVCILGDCSAWKKLCICFRRRGGNNNTIGRDGADNDDDRVDDVEMNYDPSTWRAMGIASTVTNPLSYIYRGCSSQKRRLFLNNITDSEVRILKIGGIDFWK